MFPPNTLFVIGAGASAELGLPLGAGLKAQIAEKLSTNFDELKRHQITGDKKIYRALKRHIEINESGHGDINSYLDAGWRIAESMPLASSIDSFIYTHQGNKKIEMCAKLAIVQCILEYERKSKLFVDTTQYKPRLNFGKINMAWHNSFMEFFADGCRKEDLEERIKNISFVIFNYDRCLEQFLYYSLPTYFDVDESVAAKLVESLDIFHPYGQVGNLPWQSKKVAVPFGSDVHTETLLSLTQQIKTYTEATEDDEKINKIKDLVHTAKLIVFLGNAFHQQNMSLLKPFIPGNPKHIFATAKGLSSADAEIAKFQIYDLISTDEHRPIFTSQFETPIHLDHNLGCYELFQNYRRQLTYFDA